MIAAIIWLLILGILMVYALLTIMTLNTTIEDRNKTIEDQEDDIESIQLTNTKNYDNYFYNKKTSQELRKELKVYKVFNESSAIEIEDCKKLESQLRLELKAFKIKEQESMILLVSTLADLEDIDCKGKKKDIKEKLEETSGKIDKYIFNK